VLDGRSLAVMCQLVIVEVSCVSWSHFSLSCVSWSYFSCHVSAGHSV